MKNETVKALGGKQAFPTADGALKGLTKREYFAALAMQGILAQSGSLPMDLVAKDAVQAADTLIAALES